MSLPSSAAMAEPPALDAPVAGLGDAEALAKAWLLELVAARPLGDAARVPIERMSADGPALVAAVIGALVSDRELQRLTPEGDLAGLAAGVGAIAGAAGPAAVVAALERLRSVIWAAIERTAPGTPPLHLAGRLAHVCAKVAETALAAGDSRAAPAEPLDDDELARIRAVRTSDGPLWVEALERQLADGSRSGRRFALLLVALDSAERLRLAGADEAADAFARIGRAVREHVRRADVVAHEDDGRVWVIAGDTGRNGAKALALRIVDAVEAAASLHGAPLTASVGIAVYPDDGREAAPLTAQAEEGMYAARAAGTRVDGGPEPEGPPQGGVRSGPWALG
jgi:diguanylate cyclase (GGDEF)-like protein